MFKVLTSRIIIFALACIWVLGWIAMGLLWWEVLTARLATFQPSWIANFLQVWYIVTVILVGIWIAMKGFRFVGKWEKDDKGISK